MCSRHQEEVMNHMIEEIRNKHDLGSEYSPSAKAQIAGMSDKTLKLAEIGRTSSMRNFQRTPQLFL